MNLETENKKEKDEAAKYKEKGKQNEEDKENEDDQEKGYKNQGKKNIIQAQYKIQYNEYLKIATWACKGMIEMTKREQIIEIMKSEKMRF